MSKDRIVAVGLLTSVELEMLGDRFDRYFPIENDDMFGDLLMQLDLIEATPLDRGVVIRRKIVE